MYKSRLNVHIGARSCLRIGIALLLLTGAFGLQADQRSDKEARLNTVLQKIEQLKQAIETRENDRSQFIRQLESIEKQVASVNRKIRRIGRDIDAGNTELAALRETRREHQRQLGVETEYLAEQVYAAFTLGRQEKVKMLFSQRDPERITRLITSRSGSKGK